MDSPLCFYTIFTLKLQKRIRELCRQSGLLGGKTFRIISEILLHVYLIDGSRFLGLGLVL